MGILDVPFSFSSLTDEKFFQQGIIRSLRPNHCLLTLTHSRCNYSPTSFRF